MSQRKLYLALYDIADPKRLASTLALVRDHAYGGQKSAYEVYLSDTEKDELLSMLMMLLLREEDRFLLIQLDQRSKIYTLGVAEEPVEDDFFCIT
ncbi:CRISPR-associated endoribonuclease Cas2 [Oligella sp. MSHR50489EDL]|uniref:CRISPR-associated endonuclease Cas2 n=1 Tax=Oligella sp. MSHR50489EDL TaxID=3139409 RepID=UPI003D815A99